MGNSRLLKSGLKRADDRFAFVGPSPADLFQSACSRWQVCRCKVGQPIPQIISNPDLQVVRQFFIWPTRFCVQHSWHPRVIVFCLIKLHPFKSVLFVATVTSDRNVIARGVCSRRASFGRERVYFPFLGAGRWWQT